MNWRRLGVAIAFSTLCFINTWVELAQGKAAYFARLDPVSSIVRPVLVWQLLIGILVFFLPSGALRIASVVPLGFVAVAFLRILPFEIASIVLRPWFWPAVLLSIVAFWLAWSRWAKRRSLPDVREFYIVALPVLALIVLQAAWRQFPSAQYDDRPNVAQRKPATTDKQRRVIWIIFDEMSQDAVFDKRPAGLEMPNLDRLRHRGVYGTNVVSPAGNTLESLPSLLTGKVVRQSVPKGPRELELHFADGTIGNWSEAKLVFDRVPVRSGLAGWFHPYCRVLPTQATSKCAWIAGALLTGIEEPQGPQPLIAAMRDRFGYQVRAFPLAGRVPGLSPLHRANEEKQRRLDWLVDQSLQMAADPSLGLLVFHYPVPHPPGGYIANLKRCDEILGRLLAEVHRAGLADRTAIIVSSDHGWRPEIWSHTADWSEDEQRLAGAISKERIPFVVHLPWSLPPKGVMVGSRWNSVHTGEIVERILAGAMNSADELAAFLSGS